MDALPSTEFRKRFARLKEPTTVTVNGHVIGEWVPVKHARYLSVQEAKATIAEVQRDAEAVRYDIRPIRPVPKKGK